MNMDRMYELAFKFRDTKLWNYVYEDELFAVKLSDGRFAFCSIMGNSGQHIALALYIGAEGFESFKMLHNKSTELSPTDLMQELDTMQLSLESADFISPDERKSVRGYAQTHNIFLTGSFAYPHFVRYRPHCHPWSIEEDSDWLAMEESLAVVVAISNDLKALNKDGLALNRFEGEEQSIPMFWLEDDNVHVGRTTTPGTLEKRYPGASPIDEFTLALLMQKPKSGTLQCEVKYLPDPVQDDPKSVPYYPAMLVTVEKKSGMFRHTGPVEGAEANPNALLKQLVDHLVSFDLCPKSIEVRTEQTAAVLRGFCESIGIQMKSVKVLPELDQGWRSIASMKGSGYSRASLNMLSNLSDSELASLPPAIKNQLQGLADQDQLPESLAKRLDIGRLNGTIVNMEPKVGPNDPCPCGSGKKYKKCCGRG